MSIKRFLKQWRWVIAYVLFIYTSLPFVPIFWTRFIEPNRTLNRFLPFVILLIIFLLIFYYLVFVNHKKSLASFIVIIISFLVAYLLTKKINISAERIHIIEYGILPFLIYTPLRQKNWLPVYFWVFIIGFSVGALDEIIQYFIPNRVFDVKDILTNTAGVFLGEIVLYNLK